MIDDLGSFVKFDAIEKVDLSHNRISFERQIAGLFDAKKTIKELVLTGNPLSKTKNYRLFIIYNLPQLEILDEIEVTQKDRSLAERVIGKGEVIEETLTNDVDEDEEELKAIRERGMLKKIEQDKIKEIEKEERRNKRIEQEKISMEKAEQEKLAYKNLVESDNKKKPTNSSEKKLEPQVIEDETSNSNQKPEESTQKQDVTPKEPVKQKIEIKDVQEQKSEQKEVPRPQPAPPKSKLAETPQLKSEKNHDDRKVVITSSLTDGRSELSKIKVEDNKPEEITRPLFSEESIFEEKKRFDILNMDTGADRKSVV